MGSVGLNLKQYNRKKLINKQMIYITLDTCVWLGLIKIDLHNEDNIFEEICYWIENKHLIHIIPENIIKEWNRHKDKNAEKLKKDSNIYYSKILKNFEGNATRNTTFISDIPNIINERIKRVDIILNYYSEKAFENETIYKEAANRTLNCVAPNHTKESFRDTVNILTLIHYLKYKEYPNVYFSTINYDDFSKSSSEKHHLHPQLITDFKNANLQYIYCDEIPFASKLLGVYLRPNLPNFQDYLKEKKINNTPKIDSPDADYLENIKHLDMIIAKKTPTALEQEIVKLLINRHDSYKQYFFNNIGNNGLV